MLNQSWLPVNAGAVPSTDRAGVLTPGIETPTRSAAGLAVASALAWRSANCERGRSEASWFWTAFEFSNDFVGSVKIDGRLVFWASVSSKRTSRLKTIATAVATRIAPSTRSTTWPRIVPRIRPITARPANA